MIPVAISAMVASAAVRQHSRHRSARAIALIMLHMATDGRLVRVVGASTSFQPPQLGNEIGSRTVMVRPSTVRFRWVSTPPSGIPACGAQVSSSAPQSSTNVSAVQADVDPLGGRGIGIIGGIESKGAAGESQTMPPMPPMPPYALYALILGASFTSEPRNRWWHPSVRRASRV
jgi:hypothetical protein